MKRLFYILILTLLAVNTQAQYVQITNLSGTTAAYGTLTASVTGGGNFTTWAGGWCAYSALSYWAGFNGTVEGPGDYKFVLNHAVSAVKVLSYALNGGPTGGGEYLELYINGAPYSFVPADITSYTDCGSGAAPCYLYTLAGGPTVIMGPLPSSTPYNGGDFIHTDCAGITSFEIYTNGNLNGITFYVYVDTVFSCFNATVNSPCLGSALIFNNPGDSTGATYVWLGPNSYSTTVATTQSFTITPSVWSDTGTYHVIKTVGGVSDTASIHAVIYPIPVISGPTSVCEGSTITLTSTVTGVTWSVSSTAIATIGAATGILTGVTPGVVVVDGTSGAGCVGTYTVTVNPDAPITGTASVCVGNTTQLTDAVAGGTWNSSNTAIATVNTSGLVAGIAGGTSTISYTTSAGCLSTRIVTVNPFDPITGVTTICVGGTSTLANAIAGGTWASSNTSVATITPTTGILTGVATGTTTITYTTPAGCISTTTVDVIVITSISGTKVVCQGSTTVLTDGSGGGAWSSTNPGIATIGAASGVVTGVSGGTTTITYTAGGSGCYATTTVTVNPTSPITGTLSMCQYYTTTLGDALAGGTWTSGNIYVATVNNTTGVVNGLTGGTATITYTSSSGCIMTVVVTVNPKPAPPVPNNVTYCQDLPGGANPISATYAGTPTWYGPGITGPLSTPPTPSVLDTGAIDYYVTQTSAFGCVSDSAEIIIYITPKPAPPITRDSAFCQGSPTVPLNFQVDSAAGSYLKWYYPINTLLSGVPTPQDAIVTYPSPTLWYVTQTVRGCESNKAPITDTIVYKPSFSIIASNPWVCDHDTLSFKYLGTTPLSFGTFQWQLPLGASIVGGSAIDSTIMVRFDTVYGQHFVYLTVGELNGMCDSTKSIEISVIPLPSTTSYMKPNICLGDTVSLALSNESASASIFSWYIDGTPLLNSTEVNIVAASSNSGGPYSLSWNDTGSHIITVAATTIQGCRSLPTNDTIEVHASPNATFTFKTKTNGTLCLEDSVLFIANYQNYNCSYFWEPVHAFNNDNKWQIWGKVEEEQSNITLIVSDPFGCVGTSTQQIDPSACCTVLFPNAFTPNGDGHNDFFRPIFNGYHKFHSFRVVNRWGQTVFESADSNPMWDGNFNGVPQDIGTYYYFIQYDCGGNTVEAKGDCTLIR